MADTSLNVTSASGGQNPTTQNSLQASGTATLNSGLTGNVQTSVTGDDLKANNGISLTPTVLPSVDLNSTTTVAPAVVPAKQHFNPVLGVFSILLFGVAIVMFKITSDSGKKNNQFK